jgi:hypothetical protein
MISHNKNQRISIFNLNVKSVTTFIRDMRNTFSLEIQIVSECDLRVN